MDDNFTPQVHQSDFEDRWAMVNDDPRINDLQLDGPFIPAVLEDNDDAGL